MFLAGRIIQDVYPTSNWEADPAALNGTPTGTLCTHITWVMAAVNMTASNTEKLSFGGFLFWGSEGPNERRWSDVYTNTCAENNHAHNTISDSTLTAKAQHAVQAPA